MTRGPTHPPINYLLSHPHRKKSSNPTKPYRSIYLPPPPFNNLPHNPNRRPYGPSIHHFNHPPPHRLCQNPLPLRPRMTPPFSCSRRNRADEFSAIILRALRCGSRVEDAAVPAVAQEGERDGGVGVVGVGGGIGETDEGEEVGEGGGEVF